MDPRHRSLRGGLNALVVSAFGGGTRDGRWAVPPDNRADHGKPLLDPPHEARAAWVKTHEEHYQGLRHRWPEEADNHYPPDRDILEDCAGPAADCGIELYPRLFECNPGVHAGGDWHEVDADGRATGKKCVNHPEWNAFTQATVEDLAKHHPQIAGIMYLQERNGPLDEVFSRGASLERQGHCFCDHCCSRARA